MRPEPDDLQILISKYRTMDIEELEAISLDSSGVKTIDLAQAEVSVNDNPVDHFNVSLNETIFDLQHRKFRKLDMSTIEAQIGVVDFGFVPSV